MTPTDFDLMAYVDGELDAKTTKAVAEAVEADPSLQKQVDQLIESRRVARVAFDSVDDAPLTEGLSALIKAIEDDVEVESAREEQLPTFTGSSATGGTMSWARANWLTFSGAAFALGLAAGWGLLRPPATQAFLQLADTESAALSREANTLFSKIESGDKAHGIQVQTSFISASGKPCRQFESAHHSGIVCRQNEGWQLVVLAEQSAADRYHAAGLFDPVAVATADLGVERVLTLQEEATMIEQGWSPESR